MFNNLKSFKTIYDLELCAAAYFKNLKWVALKKIPIVAFLSPLK